MSDDNLLSSENGPLSCVIDYRLRRAVDFYAREPDYYIDDFVADVYCRPADEDDHSELAGRASFCRVHVGAAESAGLNLFDVFDAHSQEMYDYYVRLFDVKTGELREDLFEPPWSDLLLIHSVEVLPAFRKRNLSYLVMLDVLEAFGTSCAGAALIAHPIRYRDITDEEGLAWRKRMQVERLQEVPEAIARRRLATHWERFGFRRIDESDYLALGLEEFDIAATAKRFGLTGS